MYFKKWLKSSKKIVKKNFLNEKKTNKNSKKNI